MGFNSAFKGLRSGRTVMDNVRLYTIVPINRFRGAWSRKVC